MIAAIRRIGALFLGTLCFCALASAEECKSAADPRAVEIVKTRFGVFLAQGDQVKLLPVSKFPAIPGANYGWYLFYKTQKSTVIWREELRAPSPIQDWGKGEHFGVFTVSPDRMTAVTERMVSSEFPLIQQVWDIGPNDPLGVYVATVYIDGVEVAKHEFELLPVPEALKSPAQQKKPKPDV
jgi:hypothetical protein